MSTRRNIGKKERFFDYTLLFVVIFLSLFGLIMIYSSSSVTSGDTYLGRQLLTTSLGMGALFAVIILRPYHFYGRFAYLGLVGSVVVLMLLLTPL